MQVTNINENKTIIIKKILPKLNFKYINFNIVDTNINTLLSLFSKIKNIYNELFNKLEFENNISDHNLKKIVLNHINKFIDRIDSKKLYELKSWNKVFLIKYNNLYFFYLYKDEFNLKKDFNQINNLAKIFFTINKMFNKNLNQIRYVIWLPITSDRDYEHNHINEKKLNESIQEYKAFTVSGITYTCSKSTRITIITRYEEIEKLLLHELIHNLHLDGSNFHDELKDIILKYNEIKQNLNYNYEYSIYESYTELLSTYLYLLFKNIDKSIDKINNILLGQILIEIIYSYNTIVNLSKLNGYSNYSDFINKEEFYGSICFYEYYYVKGLLYNNLILVFPKNLTEFKKLYENIIFTMLKSNSDLLLKHMFKIYQKQKNFKYIFN